MSSSPESDSSDAALNASRGAVNADQHQTVNNNANIDYDDVDEFDGEFELQDRSDVATPWDSGGEDDSTHVRRPQSQSIFNPSPSKYQKLQYDTIAPPAAVHHSSSLHSSIVRPHYLHSYETPKLPNHSDDQTPTINSESHQARLDQLHPSASADADPEHPPVPCSTSPLLLCVTLMGFVFILCGILVGISLSVQPKREDHVALYNAAVEGWNKVERATFSHASFTIQLRSPLVDATSNSLKPSSLHHVDQLYRGRRLLEETAEASTAGQVTVDTPTVDSSSSDPSTTGVLQSSTAAEGSASSIASSTGPEVPAQDPTAVPTTDVSSTGELFSSTGVSFLTSVGAMSSSSDSAATLADTSSSTSSEASSTGESSSVDSSTAPAETMSSTSVTSAVDESSTGGLLISSTGGIDLSSSTSDSRSSAEGSTSDASSGTTGVDFSSSSSAANESSSSGPISDSSTGSTNNSTSAGSLQTGVSSTAEFETAQSGGINRSTGISSSSSSSGGSSVGNYSSSTSDSSTAATTNTNSSSTGAETDGTSSSTGISSSSTGSAEPKIPTTNPTIDPWFLRANQTYFDKQRVGDKLNDVGVDVAKYQPLFFSLSASSAVSGVAVSDAPESLITPFPTSTYDEIPQYLIRNYSQPRRWIDREDFSLNHTTIRIEAATPSSVSYSSSDPLATNALEISLPFLRQDLSKTSALTCTNKFFGLYDTVHGTCLSFRQLNSICLRITHATVEQIKQGWKLKSQQVVDGQSPTAQSPRAAAMNPIFASAVLNSTVANNATRWIFDDEELPGWYEAMGDDEDSSDSSSSASSDGNAALLLSSTVTTPYWYDSQGETSIGDTTPDGDGLDTHKATVPGCVRHDSGWQLGVYVPVHVTKYTPTASGSITGGDGGKNRALTAHTWKVSAHQLLKRFPQLSSNPLPFSFKNAITDIPNENGEQNTYQRRTERTEAENDPSGSSVDMYMIHLNLPTFNITVRSRADPYLMAQSLTSSSLWFGFPASELILFTVLLIFMGLLMEIAPAYHFARWWTLTRRNKLLAEEEDAEDDLGTGSEGEDDEDLELSEDTSSEDDQLNPKKEVKKSSTKPPQRPQLVVQKPSVDIQMTQLNVHPPSASKVHREQPLSSRSDSHELDAQEELELALAMEASPQAQQTEDEMEALDM